MSVIVLYKYIVLNRQLYKSAIEPKSDKISVELKFLESNVYISSDMVDDTEHNEEASPKETVSGAAYFIFSIENYLDSWPF